MLVLSFKQGENVTIGEATAKVLEVRGKHVTLCFDTPDDVRILRDNAKNALPRVRKSHRLDHLSDTWRSLLGGKG